MSNLQDLPSISTIQYGQLATVHFSDAETFGLYSMLYIFFGRLVTNWYTYHKTVLPRNCDKGIFLILRLEVKGTVHCTG